MLALDILRDDGNPTLTNFASTTFGIFYCGFLPAFWVSLRNLAIPAVHTSTLATHWPTLLGGPPHVTVGLVATLTSVCAIIAADAGAYFVGRAIGRTSLTSISPKKTVEGAAGGLTCAMAAVWLLGWLTKWPLVWWGAPLLGCAIFCTSLIGDLIESSMKRDAGVKDSGNVIPGHGGVLDRFDSYIFTGAIVYCIIRYVLPLFGL